MTLVAPPPPPLTRREIHEILQSLHTQPDAFWATTASLYGWCKPSDVSAALALIAALPIPRCLHSKLWNKCEQCTSVQRIAVAN